MTKHAFFSLFLCALCTAAPATAKHALTLFDSAPKYSADFTHFDYVNPDAPKGGNARMSFPLTFDSLNPFILKGLPAPGIEYLFDTLMTPSRDEPQSYYPLVAKDVALADDGTSITYTLNQKARFHDGSPVTADDIIFSFNIIKEKGHPFYQLQYRDIERASKTGKHKVTFSFATTTNRELPFITAGIPVLSKAFYSQHPFDKSSLTIPMTSGPYRVTAIDPGRYIEYERVEKYWARDLPSRKGMFNFATMRHDVYRDETVALEAFKAGEYDYREEYIARNWALSYNFDAVKEGRVVIDETPHKIPRGMQGFIYNLRKDKFSDRRVREAIALSFDFQWMNRTLFYGAYARNDSFFQNTDFAASELPSPEELALLEPHRDTLPPSIFTDIYTPPVYDGSGFIRDSLIKADKLLKEAGWIIKDGHRVHAATGEQLTIEFLARQRSMERVVAAMQRNLRTLGIIAKFRTVDDAQYQKRWEQFDFDMTTIWWNTGVLFPGNEQQSFWHCSQADVQGSKNLSGFCHPLTDALLDRISNATNVEDLTHAARALDRIITHEHIVIPHFSIYNYRMAYWDKFGIPDTRPLYDRGFETWWITQ